MRCASVIDSSSDGLCVPLASWIGQRHRMLPSRSTVPPTALATFSAVMSLTSMDYPQVKSDAPAGAGAPRVVSKGWGFSLLAVQFRPRCRRSGDNVLVGENIGFPCPPVGDVTNDDEQWVMHRSVGDIVRVNTKLNDRVNQLAEGDNCLQGSR